MNPKNLSKHVRTQKEKDALAIIETCEQEVTALLKEHIDALENIVLELQSNGTLAAQEVVEIVEDTEEE